MKKVSDFFVKFKSIKHIEIYIALVLALIVIALIALSGFSTQNATKNTINESYISQMEHKIVSVIEKIDGCGNATAAISHDA